MSAARLAAAALIGAASVGGFAPFHLFPLPLLALAWLLRVGHRSPSVAAAARLGWAFGLGFFLAGVSWVYVSLHQYGGMPAPLAGLGTALFCAGLALFPALAMALFRALRGADPWRASLLAAAAWTLTEWLRGWLFTGFPWLALGYAQTPPSPLAGYAPVLGVYGLSFLVVLLAGWVGIAWGHRARLFWAGASVVLVLGGGFALARLQWTQPAGAPVEISLLQGNIEQSLKWRPDLLRQSLDTYAALARANPATLVVLPETALPLTLDQIPGEYLQDLARAAPGGDVLFGVVRRDQDGRFFNSAASVGVSAPQRYDKSHLVPFGEFTPPAFGWTLSVLSIPMSNFSRGAPQQPPLLLGGQRVAVNICYEDVFGEDIARALPQATLLVNLSNTAWFGDSLAQPQHLQIAQLRALETGRTMLRATNTGYTAVVRPNGVVSEVLPAFSAGALRATVQGYGGSTPYARWGNWPVLGIAAAGLLLALSGRRRH
jgi:apolipoprotein N-acyltransferase